jgi:hypothetical protein
MKKAATIIFLLFACLSGCAPSATDMFFRRPKVEIPQIAAHIEPAVKDNRIYIYGKILIQNPTESDLELGETVLEIKDEEGGLLDKIVLKWKEPGVGSKNALESPVEISLDLSVLKNEYMAMFLKTEILYKTLKIRIPIENKLAEFHFDFLRENIVRPLDVIIHTKLHSDVTGDSRIDFVLDISNPAGADLLLENGMVEVYTEEEGSIAETSLKDTLFRAGERNQIRGTIGPGNIFGTIISHKLLSKYPLRIKFTGLLTIPETDIAMPFSIESVQEVDFSLLPQ